MTGRTRTPARVPVVAWAFASAALHALVAVASFGRTVPERASAAPEPATWMETVTPQPHPPASTTPEPALQPPPKQPARAPSPRRRAGTASAAKAKAPGPTTTNLDAADVSSDDGTLAVESEATGGGGDAEGEAEGSTGSGGGAVVSGSQPERRQGPAELSLWMDPRALTRMALVRPAIAVLMSVPGYRDALRGSGIRPFFDLQRLRIRLPGRTPERLSVAGVHAGGEQALRDVAQRIAAIRNRKPTWRGDADLRATSWVDGSGVDRGLAVRDGAFVIAERATLPALLGADAAADRVGAVSRMRERVVMLLSVEDAASYLPGLQTCGLQALRVSVAERGGGYRMALAAHYAAASAASQARTCVRALDATAAPLSRLLQWLARAAGQPDSYSTSLHTEVTNDDVGVLLDALAWALRSA